ncbi:NUC091 domain-containing protein [Thamnocephalis sphaerospora]|uniref:Nucleolar GTP-binding protein 2 n=1 Tax=Thamnocephalis sphaerospora TaxID=78915 RepID=A0A4P9XN90_9FUNG|nr:NUC091 domain-containing protein [Thamnocephalis sphaerospora]|eukprot:RKP07398.1 NUC091 domain-containing protein [Thamnocephalis sphaerospora]
MGKFKKEASRVARDTSDRPANTRLKGENFYHDKKKVQYLNMLRGGRAVRDRDGNIVKAAAFQSTDAPVARIAPNRKWFGNTRVIGQKELQNFREKLGNAVNDPYQVLLQRNKLPMSLLQDATKESRVHMLETESFSHTFGPKAQRKRPKIFAANMDEMLSTADDSIETYDCKKDSDLVENSISDHTDLARESIFQKGQSKRIWGELYKVMDSSDVVVHVLDVRDPLGTRCRNVETYLSKEAQHKHLIFVLNKCDLVPTWVTARWVKILSREYPTLAFHASINNSFGKGALIQLLRQFGKLHADKKQISVGFIGYPNTGKSSIINTLRKKRVCSVAPIPGETKVWQYITLMRKIYLIDCPGVVYPSPDDSEADIVLKGVVRVENLKNPEDYIGAMLERVRPEYLRRTYEVRSWDNHEDFLSKIAKKAGKLLKGGEPDLPTVAKMVLNDWLRGKIPFYTAPPEEPIEKKEGESTDVPMENAGETSERRTMGVEQLFRKIQVATAFLPDDMKRDDVEKEEAEKERIAKEMKQAKASNKSAEAVARRKAEVAPDDDDEDMPDWDEVYESVVGEEVATLGGVPAASASAEDDEDEDDDEDDDDDEEKDVDDDDDDDDDDEEDDKRRKQVKQPRMTTNKKKVGTHYYETANVKNRNRNKQRPEDPNKQAKRLQSMGAGKKQSSRRR